MQGRYYAKLGILSTIKDEDEDEEEKDKEKDKENKSAKKRSTGDSIPESKASDELSDGEYDLGSLPGMGRRVTAKLDQKFREEADRLLKDAKEGNFKRIQDVLKSIMTNSRELDMKKIKKLIDERGNGGWNAFHFAIFFGHLGVVQELLNK